jgi:hypothetical protein
MTLELRCVEMPRSQMVLFLEQATGQSLTHEYRHFLGHQPVHFGMLLEYWEDSRWILGRYEWSCRNQDLPILRIDERVVPITSELLLRWPE